jgi:hypothetical protein
LKIIHTENKNINDIDNIIKIFDKLNNLNNKTEIAILVDITDILFYNIQDNDKFYELSNLIIKKFVKNSTKFSFYSCNHLHQPHLAFIVKTNH